MNATARPTSFFFHMRLLPAGGTKNALHPMGRLGLFPAPAREALIFGVLVFMVLLPAYLPAIGGDFLWDDTDYVKHNPALRTLGGLRDIWLLPGTTPQYYPLVFTTFWIEYQAWGAPPALLHLVNLALHAAAAAGTGLVLRRLGLPGAWFAAFIFAAHPVSVESAAWITERKNVLSGALAACSLLAGLNFLNWESGPAGRRAARWLAAFIPFVFALLSKTVTAFVPGTLLVIVWWRTGRVRWSDLLSLLPFFAAGAVLGLHTAWLEQTLVGATGPEFDWPVWKRILVAGRAPWFYLGKLAWPSTLSFFYKKWRLDDPVWTDWIYPAATAALLAILLIWAGKSRGMLAACLCFGGALLPALGFTNVFPMLFSHVADHFQYHAIPVAAAAGASALTSAANRRPPGRIAAAGGIFAALTLVMLSRSLTPAYRSLEALMTRVIEKTPDSWMAHTHLGVIAEREGSAARAAGFHAKAVELNPSDGLARLNLSALLRRLGRVEEARLQEAEAARVSPELFMIQPPPEGAGAAAKARGWEARTLIARLALDKGDYQEALRLLLESASARPADSGIQLSLASLYLRIGQPEEAAARAARALEIDPGDESARIVLGDIAREAGQFEEALAQYRAALALSPDSALARVSAGMMLRRLGRPAEAESEFRRALALRSDYPDALFNLGALLAEANRLAEAEDLYLRALRVQPDFPEARFNFGNLLLRSGREGEAEEQFRLALSARPTFAAARVNLGLIHARRGRIDEAAREFEAALRDDPANEAAAENLAKARAHR